MAPRLVLDPRTLRLILIAFLVLAALTAHRLFFAEAPPNSNLLVFAGNTMGTTYQIRVAGKGLDAGLRDAIEAETTRRLHEVDAWMSNWNPESDVSRFNAYPGIDGFPVSFATAEVVASAIEVHRSTDAAFDITVGPLVALWGFGNGARIGDPPSQEEIDRLREHVGDGVLRVERGDRIHGGRLWKDSPETQIDLSAIAKGFGVDHVAAGLRELGRLDFLVEIGGELSASGERPGGGAWRVAIERPQEEGRSVQNVVELKDRAMATSGDYRIFYREGGKRISHTIDPRSGRPVETGPASSTTIAENAMLADAWATALMVMGDEGLPLAESEGIAAMLMWRDENGGVSIRKNGLFPASVRVSRPTDRDERTKIRPDRSERDPDSQAF